MNKDKTSTDDFACAVDDMLNDVSFVIYDKKHIDNTLKHDHIRTSLNYDKKIQYAYLPAITGNPPTIKWLLEEGFLPSAISNYLLLLGNKPPCEIFSIKDAIKWFDLSSISNSPALFDIDRLKQINQQHLKDLDAKELSRYVGFADAEVGELARLYLQEAQTTKELKSKITAIFAKKEIPKEYQQLSTIMIESIKKAPYFEQYEEFKNHIIKETKLNDDDFLNTLRYILVGSKDTPDITMIYKHIKNYIGGIIK